jgi:hypothetical protein
MNVYLKRVEKHNYKYLVRRQNSKKETNKCESAKCNSFPARYLPLKNHDVINGSTLLAYTRIVN